MDTANTFKILIATDNHLGFMERDGVRANDSFNAFEEILKIARDRNVDFVVLGGDLFHDNQPSRKCLHTTMTLLRQYCLGDRSCPIEFLSDQSENFPDRFATVNYQDPNYNISIPIFSIHGNHDEPSGAGGLCALDLLSITGLINYFGKQPDLDDVAIKPLLMRKGTSKLALFGLGNIRDDRLNRIFENKKVTMYRPTEDPDGWFNMLVLHQNRVAHAVKNYLPSEYLQSIARFLHLCLWGHEHECLIEPESTSHDSFFITQPGSSVATSLCEGEAVEKNVAILNVHGTEFQIEKIPLKTVRPFVMDTIVLSEIKDLDKLDLQGIQETISEKIKSLIVQARVKWRKRNPTAPPASFPKPLIRLRVDYTNGFKSFHPQRFGQNFVDEVANPSDIVFFFRKKAPAKRRDKKETAVYDIDDLLPGSNEDLVVESLVGDFLKKARLQFLPENEFTDIVSDYVVNKEKYAIETYIDKCVTKTKSMLKDKILENLENDDQMKAEITKVKESIFEKYASNHAARTVIHGQAAPKELDSTLKTRRKFLEADEYDDEFEGSEIYYPEGGKEKPKKKTAVRKGNNSDDDDDDDVDGVTSKKKAPRKPAARVAKKPAGRVAKKPAAAEESEDDSDAAMPVVPDSEDEENVIQKRSSNRAQVIDSDEEMVQKAVKKVPARRRAPAAPAKASSSRGSSISNSFARSGWSDDDDEIIEDVEPAVKPIPQKRAASSMARGASKKAQLSSSLKQTTIAQFSQETATSGTGRKTRRNPF